MSESRSSKGIKNGMVALMMYFFNLSLQFFSRKIFLEYLGTEILGLNSTASNLLQFLNISELGIGAAVGCTLYKPLFENDHNAVAEIIALQGKLYKIIAGIVIIGAIAIMPFFPIIFSKMELPLWYAYASFSVLLFSSLLSYFFNYKQIVLSADQKEYKIHYTYKLSSLIKVICQTVAIYYFSNAYIWWLTLEVAFAIIGSISLSIVIRHDYPYLCKTNSSFSYLRTKYPYILSKVKQVFFHKISAFALNQLSPLIIFAFTSLSEVAIYGNYLLIITGISSLMGAIFNNISAGIGNLISEQPNKVLSVFAELFSFRFFIATIGSFSFFYLASPFVSVWIGDSYRLPYSTVIILSASLFILLIRQAVDNFLYAYGLFKDIWAPVAEMIINIGAAVALGYYFGLNGVLVGSLISLIVIVMSWKPYFLFNKGFHKNASLYWRLFIKHMIIASITFIALWFAVRQIDITPTGWLSFIIMSFTYISICGSILLILMNITRCPLIHFEKRLYNKLRHFN